MSQDGKTYEGPAVSAQSVSVVAIAVGFAVLIGAYLIPRDNLWLLIPLVMLEIGVYGLGLAMFSSMRGSAEGGRWGNDRHFTLFWSSLVIVLGVMWFVYDSLANIDLVPAFVAVFLFYFGASMALMGRGRATRARTW